MVDTMRSLTDEQIKHISRYVEMQTGLTEYNSRFPLGHTDRDECLYACLQSASEVMLSGLLEDLEDFPEEQYLKFLAYIDEQLQRAVFPWTLRK